MAASEARHASTHASDVIKRDRITGWPLSRRRCLELWFPMGSEVGEGRPLQMTERKTESNLKVLADYGFLIFKQFSIRHGYVWEVYEREVTAG